MASTERVKIENASEEKIWLIKYGFATIFAKTIPKLHVAPSVSVVGDKHRIYWACPYGIVKLPFML
jgi:hypothetical protein